MFSTHAKMSNQTHGK